MTTQTTVHEDSITEDPNFIFVRCILLRYLRNYMNI
jgi:hypothetical protein